MNTLNSFSELARLLRNMIRTGVIVSVDTDAGRCRVQTGKNVTDWLQWLTYRAGRSRTWWAPSVGEQVLILAVGGELDTAFVLPGIFSDDNPAPSASADAVHLAFPDGAVIEYEPASGALKVSGIQTASISAAKSATVTVPVVTVTASTRIPQITITRSDGDRHQFAIADRGAYTGVTAKWLHTKDPKPKEVKVKRKPKVKHLRALEHPKATKKKKEKKEPEAREGEYMAGEADNVFVLTTTYASKAQAMRAAQAKWDKLQRGVAEFSITLARGRAEIYPETPAKVSGFKRIIDEQDWTITKVTHSLNNSGFVTALELEVKLSDVEYETEQGD